jgi:tight adherence protein B
MNAWIPAVLVFTAVGFGTIALALLIEGIRAMLRRREVVRRVDDLMAGKEAVPGAQRGELFRASEEEPTALETILARVPRLRDLPRLIEYSGVDWTAGTFVLITLGLAAAFGLFGLVASGTMLAVILAALGAYLPLAYLRFRKYRSLARFEEVFPEAVDMLGRAIRAGHPLSAGIQMVGQEMAEPVAAEFRTIFEEQRFGVLMTDALMGMVDRVDLVDVRIFVTAILVQREVGGNLSEILDNITETIRARFKIRRQLRTYTAQGRLTGMVVGTAPIFAGVAFYLLDPDYMRLLFEHPTGRMFLMIAVTMQIFGFLWIRRIVNIEI